MKILYDGKVVGSVIANRTHSLQELVKLSSLDLEGLDPYGEPWVWELFETEEEAVVDAIVRVKELAENLHMLHRETCSAEEAVKYALSEDGSEIMGTQWIKAADERSKDLLLQWTKRMYGDS